jgi:hypothetical protein
MPIYTVMTAGDGRITSTAIMSENHRQLTLVHKNHWEVTEDQYRQITGGGRWTYLGGVIVPGWPTEEELDQLKRIAKLRIDREAELARGALTTFGVGQSEVYREKRHEADLFMGRYADAGQAAQADAADWPLLSAEVGITAASMFEVAQIVSAKAQARKQALSAIEALRLAAKRAVDAASSRDDISLASKIDWPSNAGG